MTDLIARLEAAERGSGELSCAISRALVWKDEWIDERRTELAPSGTYWFKPEYADRAMSLHRDWTESLDAIAALTAEKLPDWDGYCDIGPGLTQYKAGLGSPGRGWNAIRCDVVGFGKTEILSRCAALLIAIEGANHDNG